MGKMGKFISFALSAAIAGSCFTGALSAAAAGTFKGTSPDIDDDTFQNPMLLTDVADPDCVAGKDPDGNAAYYLVSTAMSYSPGAPIMRSYDLINWETVSYVYDSLDYNSDALSLRNGMNAYGKGQWATSIRYQNDKYYILFSSYTTGKTYVYTTGSIENGPWKKSVIDGLYHDPSLYFDTDGSMYAIYGGGQGALKCSKLIEDDEGFVSADTSFDEKTLITDMGAYLTELGYKPDSEGNFIINGEGTHAYCVDGKLYLIFISWVGGNQPADKESWIRLEGCYQAASLSDAIARKDEAFTGNIILMDRVGYKGGEGVAQGGIMNTTGDAASSEGDWKGIICQDRGPIGRCPFLVDVTWTADKNGLKWPMLSTKQTMKKPIKGGEPKSLVVSDNFMNGAKRNVYPAVTKAPAEAASLSGIELAEELTTADSIVQNPTCDSTDLGEGPWFWGPEEHKTGSVVTIADEENPSNKYMRITGRETVDSGIFQWCNKPNPGDEYPSTLPEGGRTYNISFKARFASEGSAAETFMLKFNDSVLASGEVLPGAWTTVTGTYTFKENEVGDFNAYRILTNSTIDFDIDDVIVAPSDEAAPDEQPELVENGDLEMGADSYGVPHHWGVDDDASAAGAAASQSNDAHGGSHSLMISGRTAAKHAARHYIKLTPGFEYSFSAWIKCSSADTFKAVLMTNYWKESTMASGEVTADGWTQISGKFTAPLDWENGMFYIMSESTTADFLVDDVSIKELAGQTHETLKDGEGDYNNSNLNKAWQWNHNPDNTCWSLTARKDWLRITTNKPVNNIQLARNILTQRSYGPTSAGTIKMDVSNMKNGDYAGLTTMQTKYGNIGVKMQNGKKYFVYQYIKEDAYNREITDDNWLTLAPQEVNLGELTGNEAYVRLEYFFGNFDNAKEDATAYFYYSSDGEDWKYAGKLEKLYYDLMQFTGYKFGIFNYASKEAGGYVDYDYFNAEDEIMGEGVLPTPSPTPEINYGELIRNGGLETGGTDNWSPFGGSKIETVKDKVKSGQYALKISGRSANWEGASQSVSGIVTGQKYHLYADIMAETGFAEPEVSVTATYSDNTGTPQYIVLGSVKLKNGEWGAVDSDFILHGELPETVTVYISSPDTGSSKDIIKDIIYIDNASIKAVRDTGTRGKDIGMHNPLVTHRYGADPFAMEYDGRLYVYMSSDEYMYDENGDIISNNYSNINSITVISSDDMVNWTDHGKIPVGAKNTASTAEKDGAAKWAYNSWAPAAAHKTINGKEKFFLYFADNASGIGVLEADSPTGPFTDPIEKPLVNKETRGCSDVVWMFDPAVFIDDDGQAYLYFGGGIPGGEHPTDEQNMHPKTARVIKLGDDMTSVVGSAVEIDAPKILEDSGIHKYKGKYYYSYCTNFSADSMVGSEGESYPDGTICYMTSDSPMGPFIYQGAVLDNMYKFFQVGGNNHHAIFKFNDEWYITYHAQTVNKAYGRDNGYRSTHINKVEFNEDGKMEPVTADYAGVPQLKNLDPYEKVEAETIAWNKGIETKNYTDTYTGNMKVTSIDDGDWISVSQADFGTKGAAGFAVNAASNKCGTIEIRLDSLDGDVVDELEIPDTNGEFKEVSADIEKITGVHDVFFTFKGTGEGLFELDSWKFTEASEPEQNGWSADASVSGGTVNITVANNTQSAGSADVYTAAYDAEGRLVKLAVQQNEAVGAGLTAAVTADMSGAAYDKIYVYVWKTGTMEPLVKTRTQAE